MRKIITLLLFLSITNLYLAQSTKESNEGNQTKNIFLKDFQVIIDKITEVHPGLAESPLPMMTKKEYSTLINYTQERISKVTSKNDFLYETKRFLANLDDGHMDLWSMSKEDRFLPVSFYWFDNDLYIMETEGENIDSLLFGKVVRIGDLSVSEFQEKTLCLFSSDKENIGFKKIKSIYGYGTENLYRYLGLVENDKLEIEYIKNDSRKSVKLDFIDKRISSFPSVCKNSITENKGKNSCYIDSTRKITYLQINSLPGNDSLINSFYLDAFRRTAENNSEYLILDLRDNMGGSSSWADEFLSYIVKENGPINYVCGWKRNEDVNERLSNDSKIITVKEKYRYSGEVYVLTSAKTFSSATWFVIGVKDNGLGKIIGTKCGNNSVRYGFSIGEKLPNTKFYFSTSQRIWSRSKEGIARKEQFIEPDVEIVNSIDDHVNNIDPCWEYVINNLIKEN